MEAQDEIAQLRAALQRKEAELQHIHMSWDWVGVEPGDSYARSAFMRGAVRGFQLGGFRWPVAVAEAAVAAQPAPIEMARRLVAELQSAPAPAAPSQIVLDTALAAAPAAVDQAQPEPTEAELEEAAQAQIVADLRADRDAVLDDDLEPEHQVEHQPEALAASPESLVAPVAPQPDPEPPLDWDSIPDQVQTQGPKAEPPRLDPDPDAEEPEDKSKHDPSWDGAKAGFFAALLEVRVDEKYEVIARYTENLVGKRPSQMKPAVREGFLGAIVNDVNGARERFVEWAAIQGPDIEIELKAKKAAAERKAKRKAALAAGQKA